MKRMLLTLGLSVTTSLAAFGQDRASVPAATLGIPSATLGIPVSVDDRAASLLPANHSEIGLPVFRGQNAVLPSPYGMIDAPKPMPKASVLDEVIVDPKKDSLMPPSRTISSGPALTSSADCDDPLCRILDGAPAYLTRSRLKLSAEYLAWWTNGMTIPALVTTGPASSNGIQGLPGTSPLLGQGQLGPNFHSGARVGFVWWCENHPCWGIDGNAFYLAQSGQSTQFNSSGSPLLARPFISANTGGAFSEIVAFPGALAGGIAIGNSTSLWGANLNLRRHLFEGNSWTFDGLFGYRYQYLNDSLIIREQSARTTPLPPFDPNNLSTQISAGSAFDRFRTSNQFNGGQIGAVFECEKGRWVFTWRSTIAIGTNSSSVDISGAQTNTFATGNVTTPGGLLALPSNIGHFTRSHFSVIPESTFNIGYNLSQHCRVFAGYNLLYWSHVLRPGDQIDTTLDVNQIPNFPRTNAATNAHPIVPFRDREFFAQGLNFGLMLRW